MCPPPVFQRAAQLVRTSIADGKLIPGEPAPSAAELSRATGYAAATCQKALRSLVAEGVLIYGISHNSRFRVAGPPSRQALANAARALSDELVTRRRAAGLRQPDLAELIGHSVTSVGHAETGRLWQSHHWWELVDKALDADGELLRLHDEYRAAEALPKPDNPTPEHDVSVSPEPDPARQPESDSTAETVIITTSSRHMVRCIAITWRDGEVTIIRLPARPEQEAINEQPEPEVTQESPAGISPP